MKNDSNGADLKFGIKASAKEVAEFLAENWHDETHRPFTVENISDTDLEYELKKTGARADPETIRTIITFSANALVGGILYDSVKMLIEKLRRKYGSDLVESDSKETNPRDQ